jgi:hypothetical protein
MTYQHLERTGLIEHCRVPKEEIKDLLELSRRDPGGGPDVGSPLSSGYSPGWPSIDIRVRILLGDTPRVKWLTTFWEGIDQQL